MELSESSWQIDTFDISDNEKLTLRWDKDKGFNVSKIHKPERDLSGALVWKTEFDRYYPSREAAQRAFERLKREASKGITETCKEKSLKEDTKELKPFKVTIDDEDVVFNAYDLGTTWNGWSCPAFEKAEADKVANWTNSITGSPIRVLFDKKQDAFLEYNEDYADEEPNVIAGEDYHTVDGIKHLYPIGAWNWTWSESHEYDSEENYPDEAKALNKFKVTIDGSKLFDAYDLGMRWNGWACPAFEKRVADEVMAWNNSFDSDIHITYDAAKDAFLEADDTFPEDEPEAASGKDYVTVDGVKHLYPIGTMSWTWDDYDAVADKHDDLGSDTEEYTVLPWNI